MSNKKSENNFVDTPAGPISFLNIARLSAIASVQKGKTSGLIHLVKKDGTVIVNILDGKDKAKGEGIYFFFEQDCSGGIRIEEV